MIVSSRMVMLLTTFIYIILIILTGLPVYYDWFGAGYLFIALILVDLPLIVLLVYLWWKDNRVSYRRVGSIFKLLMFFGLLAIFFGKK